MLNLIILLFGVPALSLIIKKCYEPTMIFRRLYLWLIYKWMKNWRKKDRYKRFFVKPFLCIYCYNVWITIFYYLLFINVTILFLPIFIGLTYIILECFMKLLK